MSVACIDFVNKFASAYLTFSFFSPRSLLYHSNPGCGTNSGQLRVASHADLKGGLD